MDLSKKRIIAQLIVVLSLLAIVRAECELGTLTTYFDTSGSMKSAETTPVEAGETQSLCINLSYAVVGASSWAVRLTGDVSGSLTIFRDGENVLHYPLNEGAGADVTVAALFTPAQLSRNLTSFDETWQLQVSSTGAGDMFFMYALRVDDGLMQAKGNDGFSMTDLWQGDDDLKPEEAQVPWLGMLYYVDVQESSTFTFDVQRVPAGNVAVRIGLCINQCQQGDRPTQLLAALPANVTSSETLRPALYAEVPKGAVGGARAYFFVLPAADADDRRQLRGPIVASHSFESASLLSMSTRSAAATTHWRRQQHSLRDIVSTTPFQLPPVAFTTDAVVQRGDHTDDSDSDDDDDGLGVGAIIGIIAVVIVGVAIILGVIIFVVKRRRTAYEQHPHYDQFD